MSVASTDAPPTLPLVFSDEEREIREAVAGICARLGGPDYHRRIVAADEPPTELWTALAEKGYLGVNLPERYGGGGLGMHALQAVGEEISAAGCSLLLIVVSPAIVGSIITRHGTEAQREQWLPAIAGGTTKVAFAITEPDAGTNSHNLSTRRQQQRRRPLRPPRHRRRSSPASKTPTRSSSSPASARPTGRSGCRC